MRNNIALALAGMLMTVAGEAAADCQSSELSLRWPLGVLMVLLASACLVIYVLSRRHKITHANVTDSHEVLVLAAATPNTYPDDPRLEAPKPKKTKKPKAKSAA